MKKLLKTIGFLFGILIIAVIILAFVAPKRISITSTQFINAPKQQVFDQIRFMKNYPKWSPFKQQDPEQKFTISETDGQVGASFSWEGVKEKSKGSQKIVALDSNGVVKINCNITEPFQSNPTFNYTLTEKNAGVEIVQDFVAEMPVPSNIFGMLLGLKDKIAATNKQGLDLLKQVVEKK
jgi:Polyketide cyclase / dehydrase and lipid transport